MAKQSKGGEMAQGSKYSDEKREQALTMLLTMSYKDVSEALNIPERTLRDWKDNEEKINPEFAELRKKKKEEFVKKSWEIIEKANKILEIRLDRELEQERNLDMMLKAIEENPDIDTEEVVSLKRAMQRIKIDSLSQLTTTIGTLYDKQALINREATINHGADASLEEVLKNLQGEEM